MKAHSDSGVGLFLTGPAIFLLLLGCLAVVVLFAWGLRRLDPLMHLGERARHRMDRGRALPMLWGLSAGVMIFAASVLLIQTHVLALLGVLLLASGACLAGAGIAVAAGVIGDDLARVLKSGDGGTLTPLRLGLAILFIASCLPLVGWLTTGLVSACGMGAVLEALLTKELIEGG